MFLMHQDSEAQALIVCALIRSVAYNLKYRAVLNVGYPACTKFSMADLCLNVYFLVCRHSPDTMYHNCQIITYMVHTYIFAFVPLCQQMDKERVKAEVVAKVNVERENEDMLLRQIRVQVQDLH